MTRKGAGMMGVVSAINDQLGERTDCFATFGLFCAVYLGIKLTCSVWDGVKSFFLAGPMGLSANLTKMGQWAVVTGATDGIGKAYAEQIAKLGINIVLISRSAEKLKNVADEIESQSKVKTKCIAVNFADGPEIYDKIKKDITGLEIGILVNNVGISYEFPGFLCEMDSEVMRNIVNVNCHSVVMMTHMILPQMESRRRGVIINNASGSANNPTPLLTVYSASKAFVDFFSRGLEVEYRNKGIIVQSVLPFFVSTKMSRLRPGTFVPTAATYVKSAMSTVGVQSRTFGCSTHALQGYLFDSLPMWLLNKLTMTPLLAARKKALRKKEIGAKAQ